jgi:hypothetical protein
VVAGLSADELKEHPRDLQNFIGSTLGVEGALRRHDDNRASNLDPYLQAQWQAAPVWSITLGARRGQVRLDSKDHYIVRANGGGCHFEQPHLAAFDQLPCACNAFAQHMLVRCQPEAVLEQGQVVDAARACHLRQHREVEVVGQA